MRVTLAIALLLACGGDDNGRECPLNDTRDCPGGYQVCGEYGWSECKPLYRDVDTGRIVATDCVFESGIYTVRARSTSLPSFAGASGCRPEFTDLTVLGDPGGIDMRFTTEGTECDIGIAVDAGGCSRLCEGTLGDATYEELLRITSRSTLEGHLIVTNGDGRRCEYDLTLTKE